VAHYLQDFGADLLADTPVHFEVRGIDDELARVRVDMRWKRHVTLIFKEAITNTLKHAGDATAVLQFTLRDAEVEVSLVDDGPGLETATGAQETSVNGSGLSNMLDRALAIGGRLDITSRAPSGTSVVLLAPLGEAVS